MGKAGERKKGKGEIGEGEGRKGEAGEGANGTGAVGEREEGMSGSLEQERGVGEASETGPGEGTVTAQEQLERAREQWISNAPTSASVESPLNSVPGASSALEPGFQAAAQGIVMGPPAPQPPLHSPPRSCPGISRTPSSPRVSSTPPFLLLTSLHLDSTPDPPPLGFTSEDNCPLTGLAAAVAGPKLSKVSRMETASFQAEEVWLVWIWPHLKEILVVERDPFL